MKNSAINKIKSFGKAGYIVANIIKAFMVLGIVLCIAVIVLLAFLPKDFITLTLSGNAKIAVDLEAVGWSLPNDINNRLIFDENGNIQDNGDLNFKLNDDNYEVSSVVKDGNKVNVEASVKDMQFNIRRLVYVVLAVLVQTVVNLVVIFFIGSLCKAFRDCTSPFEDNIIRKMHNLGYSMIPMVFISTITKSVTSKPFSEGLNISWGVDLTVIIAILIVFAIAYIFKYGAMLQQESDETL